MGAANRVVRTTRSTESFSPLEVSAPNRCLPTKKFVPEFVETNAEAWLVTNPKHVISMIFSKRVAKIGEIVITRRDLMPRAYGCVGS